MRGGMSGKIKQPDLGGNSENIAGDHQAVLVICDPWDNC